MNNKYYILEDKVKLYLGNSFEILKSLPKNSFDLIFADPPYFLSNNGITCHSGKQVINNKGIWDKTIGIEEKISFNRKWINLCKKLLKDNGTIWISGTMHNIYSIGVALEMEGFSIINNITWVKPNPSPNLSCRCFTHSTETIIWARKALSNNKKGNHFFDYKFMKELNNNKQMKDVWEFKSPSKEEKIHGKHPTQKPEKLLERIIISSTKENDLILDPFNGSGTTGVISYLLNRKYIGIDLEKEFLDITIKRIEDIKNGKKKL